MSRPWCRTARRTARRAAHCAASIVDFPNIGAIDWPALRCNGTSCAILLLLHVAKVSILPHPHCTLSHPILTLLHRPPPPPSSPTLLPYPPPTPSFTALPPPSSPALLPSSPPTPSFAALPLPSPTASLFQSAPQVGQAGAADALIVSKLRSSGCGALSTFGGLAASLVSLSRTRGRAWHAGLNLALHAYLASATFYAMRVIERIIL